MRPDLADPREESMTYTGGECSPSITHSCPPVFPHKDARDFQISPKDALDSWIRT